MHQSSKVSHIDGRHIHSKRYSTKFNHLATYALKIANTERGQMEKFIYGFDLVIARDVTIETQSPKKYGKVLSKALRVNVFVRKMYGQSSIKTVPLSSLIPVLVLLQQVSSSNTPIQRGLSLKKKEKKPFKARGNKKGYKSNKKQRVLKIIACQSYNRHYKDECLTRQTLCYRCCQLGHMAKVCLVVLAQIEQPANRATA